MNTSVLVVPAAPTTLNFRFISVPAPAKFAAWKAEMIKWPGLAAFGVTDIELLNVPVISKAGFAGCTTAGSKVICRSYEMIP